MEDKDVAHHHPNYIKIWAILFVLLLLGMGAGMVGNPTLATILVFSVAFIKAGIVVSNYMHLKFEPKFLKIFAAVGALCILILLIGLIPDIVYVYGD